MSKKIDGMVEAYRSALNAAALKGGSKEISVSSELIMDMVEYISELENAVIDQRAALRTCYNSASGALDQYKDL